MTDKGPTRVFQRFKHDLKLTDISPVYFIRSAWEDLDWNSGRVSGMFLTYRLVFLSYFLFCLSQSIYRDSDRNLWLIWATNISLVVQTLYALVFFTNLFYRFIQNRRPRRLKEIPPLNLFDSTTWFLLNLAGTVPYIVTMGFWMFVSVEKKKSIGGHMGWYFTDHGVNALLALIDILVVAIPVRFAGVVYTIATALFYLLFSALYEVAGGTYLNEKEEPYIYVMLNWREEPWQAFASCILGVFTAFIFHVTLWLLFKLRTILVAMFRHREDLTVKENVQENLQMLFISTP